MRVAGKPRLAIGRCIGVWLPLLLHDDTDGKGPANVGWLILSVSSRGPVDLDVACSACSGIDTSVNMIAIMGSQAGALGLG